MEQETTLNYHTLTEKAYKDREIWVGTFLGGPLVAGYLVAKNFKTFGESDKARKTWIIAIIATVFLFGIAFFAPYIDRIPRFILPLVIAGIAYVLTQMYQREKIEAHVRAGGRIHSWWRTLGIAILGGLVTAVPFIGMAYMLDAAAIANETTKTYGIMKHEIAFDKSNVSEAEIDAIADGFRKTNFFNEQGKWFVYAQKVGNNYELSISVKKSTPNNPRDLEWFAERRNDMQELFPNNKIVFNLIAGDLDNVLKRIE